MERFPDTVQHAEHRQGHLNRDRSRAWGLAGTLPPVMLRHGWLSSVDCTPVLPQTGARSRHPLHLSSTASGTSPRRRGAGQAQAVGTVRRFGHREPDRTHANGTLGCSVRRFGGKERLTPSFRSNAKPPPRRKEPPPALPETGSGSEPLQRIRSRVVATRAGVARRLARSVSPNHVGLIDAERARAR